MESAGTAGAVDGVAVPALTVCLRIPRPFKSGVEGDILVTRLPPNNGAPNTIGSRGVNATDVLGFNIRGTTNAANPTLVVGGTPSLCERDGIHKTLDGIWIESEKLDGESWDSWKTTAGHDDTRCCRVRPSDFSYSPLAMCKIGKLSFVAGAELPKRYVLAEGTDNPLRTSSLTSSFNSD